MVLGSSLPLLDFGSQGDEAGARWAMKKGCLPGNRKLLHFAPLLVTCPHGNTA